jgi:hypothetical protein
MTQSTFPKFTADASLYRSRGMYCGDVYNAAGFGEAVVRPAGPREWIKDKAFAFQTLLDKNQHTICNSAASSAGAATAGLCRRGGGDAATCSSAGETVRDALYDHCMTG